MNNSLCHIFEKYESLDRDKLIPILQDVQDEYGYLSKEHVIEIGRLLNFPVSKIYGVATFYNQFRFQPRGKYNIQVCRGTACHVKGSAKVLETLMQDLGIEDKQTSKDGLFSLEVVACIGACGLAPVICINNEFFANLKPEDVRKIINDFRAKEMRDEK